jgi:hypothetical protein
MSNQVDPKAFASLSSEGDAWAIAMGEAKIILPTASSVEKVGVPVTSYSCVENVSSPSPAPEPLHAKICPQGANCKYSENFEHCKKVLEVYLNKSAARKAGGEASSTPCKNGDKCKYGTKCRFLHNAQSAAKNLTPSPAAGGGKKKSSVNTHWTQICTLNLRAGGCSSCKTGSCAFAPSWELLHASHSREIAKNSKFTVDVSFRGELEKAPYNGVRTGNGKISLTPPVYCEWVQITLDKHVSADEKIALANLTVNAAIAAGASLVTALAASELEKNAAIAVGAQLMNCVSTSL